MSTNTAPRISIPIELSFATPIRYTTGDKPSDVVIGLLGADTYPDLIVANAGSKSITVHFNNGLGEFTSSISYASFYNSPPLALSVAKINNDAYGDVVAITNSSVSIFLSNENGTLQTPTFYTNNGWQSLTAVATGKIDTDTDIDVVVTDATTNKLYVVQNDGTAVLNNQTPPSYATGNYPIAVTLGDVDKDGWLDALVVNNDNTSTPTLSVLINNKIGGFKTKVDYTLATGALDVTTADLNGDGWLDIIVGQSQEQGNTLVLLNKGDGTFGNTQSYSAGAYPLGVAVGLLGNDNRADIAVATSGEKTFAVLQNQGNATFNAPNTFAVVSTIDTPKPTDIAVGDLNGDGKNDVAITSEHLDSVSLLLNTTFQTRNFTEQTPLLIAPTILIEDPENNWIDGWLHVAITKNGEAGDDLVLQTSFNEESDLTDYIWFDKVNNGVRAGSSIILGRFENKVTSTLGKEVGKIEIHFTNPNYKTNEWVQKIAQSILFTNESDTPSTATREVTITAIDASHQTSSITQQIAINAVNDAPQELFIEGVPIVGQTLHADTSTFSDADGLNKANITWQWLRDSVNITGATNSTYTVTNNDLGKSLSLQAKYRDGAGNNEVFTVTTDTVKALNEDPLIARPSTVAFQTSTTLKSFTDASSLPVIGTLDLNHDGILDLLVAKSSSAPSNQLVVLRGSSNGTFTQDSLTYTLGNTPSAIAFGDVDNDTFTDIAITNKDSNSVSLLRVVNGVIKNPFTFSCGSKPTALAIADFNDDGFEDIVTANSGENTLSFLQGNGNGTFAPTNSITTASAPYGVVAADFNGDGKSDIAYSDSGNDRIVVCTYNNESWSEITNALVGDVPHTLVATDFNGDGKSDIATINSGSNNVSVLLNNGDGTVATAKTYTVKSNASSLTALLASDVDGDGFADLAVSHTTGVSLLMNNGTGGNGTFALAQEIVSNRITAPPTLASADVNGDNLTDILFPGSYTSINAQLNSQSSSATLFTEQTPIEVTPNLTLRDPNGDASWRDGKLQVQINYNTTAYDVLALPTEKPELGGVWIDSEASNALMVYDQQTDTNLQIGTADNTSVSNNSTWTFTFNRYATNALVEKVAQSITFSNNRDNPSLETRTILFTATDSLGASSSATQHITVQPVDDAPLTLISATPVDGAGNVEINSNLSFTFSENIVFGSGFIELHRDAPNGALIEHYDVATHTNLGLNGTTLTIDPYNQLAYGTRYFVTFGEGAIDNGYGTTFSGSEYDFLTATDPYVPPTPNNDGSDGGSSTGTILIGTGSLALLALAFL
uniref:SbsA Ig-like domain-containing protein n=1 Tax=Chlorobium chlorochromatii (strain CaD3) TaxID=340177 RepID=Q3AQ73_CHLCH